MSTIGQDGRGILNCILFDLRGHLTAIVQYSALLLEDQPNPPPDFAAWLHKWSPAIDQWRAAESETRPYTKPDQPAEPDWEALIAELGSRLDDVATAYGEAQTLSISAEDSDQDSFRVLLVRAVGRLAEFRQSLLAEEW